MQTVNLQSTSGRRHGRVGGLLLKAAAVLAILSATTLVGTSPAPAATSTVVSLTFDDGQASQRAVMDMLDAHGMKGTFYINSALVGSSDYYMTWAQIHDIYNDGHEIGGHTLHHTNLTTVKSTTATTEVCNDRQALIAQGLGAVTSFAYPEAAVNATAEGIVKSCGYTSGRGVGDLYGPSCSCPYAETIPPADAYQLRTPGSADTSTTLADLQADVTNAETHGGGWVPLVFHGICDDACTDVNTLTVATFTAFLDWLQQRGSVGTTVRTVGDVMGGGTPPPPPPPATPVTTISCNQAACTTGWYRAAPVRVSLATTAPQATTWFTTDGTDPTTSATRQQYAGPLDLTESATVRFYSVAATGETETPRSQAVAVDAAAPTATLTAPAAGTTISRRSGTVSIKADARDLGTGSSSPSGVQKVVFYDGSTTIGTATAPSPGTTTYAVNWNVRQATIGQHSLKAVATDVAGNATTSASRSVTVAK